MSAYARVWVRKHAMSHTVVAPLRVKSPPAPAKPTATTPLAQEVADVMASLEKDDSGGDGTDLASLQSMTMECIVRPTHADVSAGDIIDVLFGIVRTVPRWDTVDAVASHQ